MEDLPPVIKKKRLPVEITIRPYMLDHLFDGRAVLPAVEAMQLLADSSRKHLPEIDLSYIANADFSKFLYLEQISDQTVTEIFNEIDIDDNGRITARLLTRNRLKKSAMTRLKEHVTLQIPGRPADLPHLPFSIASVLEKDCFEVPSDQLYRDLVPFGPAYQNIQDTVILAEDGAIATVSSSSTAVSLESLGSPFPLDAAFHAACAWGQRFSPIVGFPVGFDQRFIFKPTLSPMNYICRVFPRRRDADPVVLFFDIWLYDQDGNPCETILGLQMRDVSGGRLKPPVWIKEGLR